MIKTVVSIVAGYAAWTVVWLGGNAALFAEESEVIAQGGTLTATGPLVTVLVLSVLCSLLAGALCARLTPRKPAKAVFILGALLLATGIAVQLSAWDAMPAWYHFSFLSLLLPVVQVGGRLA